MGQNSEIVGVTFPPTSLEEGDVIVLDAGAVVRLPLEYAPVGVVAEAVAPPQLLLDPGHAVVVLLRLFLREWTRCTV